MVRRPTQGVLRILRLCSRSAQACSGLLRPSQALLRHAHPWLRLKQQLLTSKTELAKGKINPDSMGIVAKPKKKIEEQMSS